MRPSTLKTAHVGAAAAACHRQAATDLSAASWWASWLLCAPMTGGLSKCGRCWAARPATGAQASARASAMILSCASPRQARGEDTDAPAPKEKKQGAGQHMEVFYRQRLEKLAQKEVRQLTSPSITARRLGDQISLHARTSSRPDQLRRSAYDTHARAPRRSRAVPTLQGEVRSALTDEASKAKRDAHKATNEAMTEGTLQHTATTHCNNCVAVCCSAPTTVLLSPFVIFTPAPRPIKVRSCP